MHMTVGESVLTSAVQSRRDTATALRSGGEVTPTNFDARRCWKYLHPCSRRVGFVTPSGQFHDHVEAKFTPGDSGFASTAKWR